MTSVYTQMSWLVIKTNTTYVIIKETTFNAIRMEFQFNYFPYFQLISINANLKRCLYMARTAIVIYR